MTPAPTPVNPHTLTDTAFAALGAGRPDAATLNELRRAQLGKQLLLLREIARDDDSVTLRVAAGEIWDDFVARTVGEGLSGVECLSGIPGSAGATPIQNVGAYGQEVAHTVVAGQDPAELGSPASGREWSRSRSRSSREDTSSSGSAARST